MRYNNRTIRAGQLAQQRRDTPAEVQARLVRQIAGALAIEDRAEAFPRLDDTNADAAIAYQDHAFAFHVARLADRPNWRRPRPDVEKLVGSYVAWRADDPASLELAARVVDRIVETGEAVWHATAQVTGRPCSCAACAKAQGRS
jgi:hypothetical protein